MRETPSLTIRGLSTTATTRSQAVISLRSLPGRMRVSSLLPRRRETRVLPPLLAGGGAPKGRGRAGQAVGTVRFLFHPGLGQAQERLGEVAGDGGERAHADVGSNQLPEQLLVREGVLDGDLEVP